MAKQEDDMLFQKPIEANLGNNGDKVKFKSLSGFHEWLERELRSWDNIDSRISDYNLANGLNSYCKECRNQRIKLMLASKSNFTQIVTKNEINEVLYSYEKGLITHAGSPTYKLIEALLDQGRGEDAAWTMLTAQGGTIDVSTPTGHPLPIIDLIRAAVNAGIVNSETPNEIKRDFENWYNGIRINVNEAKTSLVSTALEATKTVEALKNRQHQLNKFEKRLDTLDSEVSSKLNEALKSHESHLKILVSNANDTVSKSLANFNATASTIEGLHKQRIAAFTDSEEESNDIKASIKFWEKKRRRHGFVALIVSFLFVILIITASFISFSRADKITALLNHAPTSQTSTPTEKSATPTEKTSAPNGHVSPTPNDVGLTTLWHPVSILTIVIPVLAFFWTLRTLLRVFFTNLSQYGDSDERVAMIETFLSLQGEGKLTASEDRILILQALFRPGPGSGAGEDGMPAHWFDLLMKRMDPKKGSA